MTTNAVPIALTHEVSRPEDRISADAHHIAQCAREDASFIVKHMWGIAVLLPLALFIIVSLMK